MTNRSRRTPAAARGEDRGAAGWRHSIRLSGFSVVMMGLLVLAVVVLAPTLHLYIEQQQQIADLKASVAQKKSELKHARAERARWDDPSYIRAQARERLYYVMPGDVSYLVIDDLAPSATDRTQPVSTKIQATRTDWVDALFASGMTAGLGTAPPDTTADSTEPAD